MSKNRTKLTPEFIARRNAQLRERSEAMQKRREERGPGYAAWCEEVQKAGDAKALSDYCQGKGPDFLIHG